MEQSPGEVRGSSAGQEIHHILRNSVVRNHIYKTPTLVPNQNQFIPKHALPTDLFTIRFIIIHLCLGVPTGLFPHQNSLCTSPLAVCVTYPRPSHSS